MSLSGDHTWMATPVPIPNTAVKHPGPMVVLFSARVGNCRISLKAQGRKPLGFLLAPRGPEAANGKPWVRRGAWAVDRRAWRVASALALVAGGMFLAASAVWAGDETKGKAAQTGKTSSAAAALRKNIEDLVGKLGSEDRAEQTRAATALIKLGPDILPVMDSIAGLSDRQKQKLGEVSGALREAQALRELAPKLADFPEEPIALASALERLESQTGVHVDDRRQKTEELPPLRLRLHKATFWQCLDAIAREADLKVSLYQPESRIALIDGPFVAVPVSYHGIFRISVDSLMTVHQLTQNQRLCILGLEVAWEPRFRPLFLQSKPDVLEVRDNQGTSLDMVGQGTGRLPIGGPCAMRWQIQLRSPRRTATKLSSIEGKLQIIGPGRMLTFTFDQLDMKEPSKRPDQAQNGVTAKLRDFSVEADVWSANIILDYPAETPDFESFESWLVNNEIYLESKTGQPKVTANGGYEIDEQSGHHAVLTYRFVEDPTTTLGKRADWKLVYKTPGALVKLPIPFAFKDVPLP